MSNTNSDYSSQNAFRRLKFATLISLLVLGYVGLVLFLFIYRIFSWMDVLAIVFVALLLQFSLVLGRFLDIYWISYQMNKRAIADKWDKLTLALLLGIATLYVFLVGLQINYFEGAIIVSMVLFAVLVVFLFHYSVVFLSEFVNSSRDIKTLELFLGSTYKYLSAWRFYFLVSFIISISIALTFVSVLIVSLPMIPLTILMAACWVYASTVSSIIENRLKSKRIAEGEPVVFVRFTLDAKVPLYNIALPTNKSIVFFGGVDSHLPRLINQLFDDGTPWGLDSLTLIGVSLRNPNTINIVHIERDYGNAEKTEKTRITLADASIDSKSTMNEKFVESYVLSFTLSPSTLIKRDQFSINVERSFDSDISELIALEPIDFAIVLKRTDRDFMGISSYILNVITDWIKDIGVKINPDCFLSLYILSLFLLVIDRLNNGKYSKHERYLAYALCSIKANKKLRRSLSNLIEKIGLENAIYIRNIMWAVLKILRRQCLKRPLKKFGLKLIIRELTIEINKSLLKSDKFEDLSEKMNRPEIEIKIIVTLPRKGEI